MGVSWVHARKLHTQLDTFKYTQSDTCRSTDTFSRGCMYENLHTHLDTFKYTQFDTCRSTDTYFVGACTVYTHTHTHSKPRAYGAYACARAHRPDMHMHTCAHDAHTSVNACILQQICTPTHTTHTSMNA